MKKKISTSKQPSQLSSLSQMNLYFLTGICFLSFFSLGLTISSLGPSLIILLENTGKEINFSKYLIFVKPLGFLIGIYLGEKLLHYFKETHIFGFCFLTIFILLLLIPQVNHFLFLTLLLFLLGKIEGILEIITTSFLVTLYKKKVAPYMNMLHFSFGLGAILSPSLIGWNIEYSQTINNSYTIFALIFLIGTASFFIPYQKKEKKLEKIKTKNRKKSSIYIIISFIFFFYVGAETIFSIWIFNYSLDVASFSPKNAGYITSFFWLAFTLSRLICIFLSTQLTIKNILNFLFLLSGLSICLLYLVQDYPLGLFLASFLLGFSLGGVFPQILIFVEEKLKLTSQVIRLFLFFACIGAIFFPTILEPLYQINRWFFINLVAFCIIAFIAFFFVVCKKINQEKIS